MTTWVAIPLILGSIALFIWGAWRDYHGRPKKLWIRYQQQLPEITESSTSLTIPGLWASVGEIGYSEFLGVSERKHSRGFHLRVDLSLGPGAIHLRITYPDGLVNLPSISIPWHQVESAGPMENDWGTQGFGVRVAGLPPEADPNHGGAFLVWAEVPADQLQLVSEKVHAYRAT